MKDNQNQRETLARLLNRRSFLSSSSVGVGAAALSTMLSSHMTGSGSALAQKLRAGNADKQIANAPGIAGFPNLPQKAKRVIFLCMAGGPSHLETFDYKPELDRMNGKPMPDSFTKGQPIAQLQNQKLKVQGHLTKFKKHGKSGQYVSDFLPWTAKMADDIAVIRSMHTDQINHDPAHTVMNTGTSISGRPSMGAWVNYGLGAASQELPGFVVMSSVGGRNPQPIASRQWGTGSLPSRFQGVEFSSTGDPVNYVKSPAGVSSARQRRMVDATNELNQLRNQKVRNPEISTRIAAMEMAFRMQTSVPELMDLSKEPKHVLDMYGAKPGDGSFASNCLLARRMAERGVRFIHLYHRGWDHHGGLVKYMNICCGLTDHPAWALIQDLKQRGMLDETLVIWGGEFGRTPMFQGKGGAGRDHHMRGFSMWMAGGGIKGGTSYGNTDDLGYAATEKPVHVRDLHATMLNQMGIDHHKLSVKMQGLDWRLTGVEHAKVIKDIVA